MSKTDEEAVQKLAKVLCKLEVDWEAKDGIDVIWGQMRSSVRQSFLVKARWVIDQMETA